VLAEIPRFGDVLGSGAVAMSSLVSLARWIFADCRLRRGSEHCGMYSIALLNGMM